MNQLEYEKLTLEKFSEPNNLSDELVQSLLENPGDIFYQFSAYYPKIIIRSIDMLVYLAENEGELKKKAIEILLRISVNTQIDLKYREKARSFLNK